MDNNQRDNNQLSVVKLDMRAPQNRGQSISNALKVSDYSNGTNPAYSHY